MNLLGIDVGTTGCKVGLFTLQGEVQAYAYREYNPQFPEKGWAELDSVVIWTMVKSAIREVISMFPNSEIVAVSVSSLGEALVPVSLDHHILGPSILNYDVRGEEFLADLAVSLPVAGLYAINGNTLGNNYSLPKLKWIRTHQPTLYDRTDKFLNWSSFIAFMLGAESVVDYSLANRSLLFDINQQDWSETLLEWAGLDRAKLPRVVASGIEIGTVAAHIASELGLPPGVRIINGAHDQCANALGCGVIEPGRTMYGMGTFHCITPVFSALPDSQAMIACGLNTEHHAVPQRYVCFIYNPGGSLVKWFRDTFAAAEYRQSEAEGRSIFSSLLAEIPAEPSSVMVLPYFAPSGPPRFIADSAGLIAGLHLDTQRGEVLKGIIEGVAFSLKDVVDSLPETGIRIDNFRVVGGGSRSDGWVQTLADIFGKPFSRPVITEAGSLGAAMIAAVGAGVFGTFTEAIEAMIRLESTFLPDIARHRRYQARHQYYQRLVAIMADYLRDLSYDSKR